MVHVPRRAMAASRPGSGSATHPHLLIAACRVLIIDTPHSSVAHILVQYTEDGPRGAHTAPAPGRAVTAPREDTASVTHPHLSMAGINVPDLTRRHRRVISRFVQHLACHLRMLRLVT